MPFFELCSPTVSYNQIELQAQRLMPTTDVYQGLCSRFCNILDHCLVLRREIKCEDGFTAGRPVVTFQVEAAARVGFKLCAFLLSRLTFESLLDVFRKFEVRLHRIGDTGIYA